MFSVLKAESNLKYSSPSRRRIDLPAGVSFLHRFFPATSWENKAAEKNLPALEQPAEFKTYRLEITYSFFFASGFFSYQPLRTKTASFD